MPYRINRNFWSSAADAVEGGIRVGAELYRDKERQKAMLGRERERDQRAFDQKMAVHRVERANQLEDRDRKIRILKSVGDSVEWSDPELKSAYTAFVEAEEYGLANDIMMGDMQNPDFLSQFLQKSFQAYADGSIDKWPKPLKEMGINVLQKNKYLDEPEKHAVGAGDSTLEERNRNVLEKAYEKLSRGDFDQIKPTEWHLIYDDYRDAYENKYPAPEGFDRQQTLSQFARQWHSLDELERQELQKEGIQDASDYAASMTHELENEYNRQYSQPQPAPPGQQGPPAPWTPLPERPNIKEAVIQEYYKPEKNQAARIEGETKSTAEMERDFAKRMMEVKKKGLTPQHSDYTAFKNYFRKPLVDSLFKVHYPEQYNTWKNQR